mmetsp:Transcript_11662/g.45379  ORF Transcript_11662/g.45379 Transcript_11662/m.45379 type:complete len:274 (-) Transcript_11662:374-1195(-)
MMLAELAKPAVPSKAQPRPPPPHRRALRGSAALPCLRWRCSPARGPSSACAGLARAPLTAARSSQRPRLRERLPPVARLPPAARLPAGSWPPRPSLGSQPRARKAWLLPPPQGPAPQATPRTAPRDQSSWRQAPMAATPPCSCAPRPCAAPRCPPSSFPSGATRRATATAGALRPPAPRRRPATTREGPTAQLGQPAPRRPPRRPVRATTGGTHGRSSTPSACPAPRTSGTPARAVCLAAGRFSRGLRRGGPSGTAAPAAAPFSRRCWQSGRA